MSPNRIAAWLAGQIDTFSSPESPIIDYDKRQQSSGGGEGIKATKAKGDETFAKGRVAPSAARDEFRGRGGKAKVEESKRRKDGQAATQKTTSKRPALANTSPNAARSSANATSKHPNTQLKMTRKRNYASLETTKCSHCGTKIKVVKCPACKTNIQAMLSSSKPQASNTKTKVMRKEIPSSTQSTSQLISSLPNKTPTSTHPQPAKRPKLTTEGKEATEVFSSQTTDTTQSTQHSPWRILIPVGLHIPRREWNVKEY